MDLSQLLADIPAAVHLDPGDPRITGVVCDSRKVESGCLFAAVPGIHCDGHDFLGAAARAGAVACLVEEERTVAGMTRILVPSAETALGRVASAFWKQPSRVLKLVGITGTNGKTTTAYLLQHMLTSVGIKAGRLGTVSYAYPSGEEAASLTTPEAPALQQALARMVREGAEAAVMEVSSHALVRKRVEGCHFACAVFTNLSQDHLDYHGTMEAYFAAKLLLFTRYAREAHAVVSADDPFGDRLLAEINGRVTTFGLERGDIRFVPERVTTGGMEGRAVHPGGQIPVRVPLAGKFNARNVACALASAWALGLDLEAAAEALAGAPQVPGRIEAVENRSGLSIFVDYAHTPDALYRVLETVRRITPGSLICVFGCGGDRDRGKRPLMAQAAARWSDTVLLTADNSRSEPTESILDEIESGLPPDWVRASSASALAAAKGTYTRLADRREAIHWAVAVARPGDSVVIAGKGHEATQSLGDRVFPFDDRAVAREALAGKATA